VWSARLELSPGVSYFVGQLGKALFAPGSHASLASLAAAFLIAFAFLTFRRVRKGRRIRASALLRALFPRHIVRSKSSLADLGYFYFNIFLFGLVFGWALLSYEVVSHSAAQALTAAFGPRQPTALPAYAYRTAITILVFLAYELGYWLNHYLSHRISFLWEFHKVHHSATVLTPLTNFRVHPVYMCIFLNILALFIGTANGFGDYIFGQATHQYVLSENNIILVFFIYIYVHLQHTELWISFTGWLGHLFMSPAHHQIHHSRNPAHFNKNLGSCLALWDWMFGTLYVPAAAPEKLEFGVEPDRPKRAHRPGRVVGPLRACRLVAQATDRSPPASRAAAGAGAEAGLTFHYRGCSRDSRDVCRRHHSPPGSPFLWPFASSLLPHRELPPPPCSAHPTFW
jgi:sterol desaturase/sphingolipid hydroxylase (fatty acid hydroxylase superfamily)